MGLSTDGVAVGASAAAAEAARKRAARIANIPYVMDGPPTANHYQPSPIATHHLTISPSHPLLRPAG